MKISLRNGQHVIYVDEVSNKRDALVTENWGSKELDTENKEQHFPSINLVFVLTDPARRDNYGQQKDHRTSCVHRRNQSAPGNYWYHPAEEVVQSPS